MKPGFFKVRRNAIILTILVILLATLFGVNRSLGEKVMEVSDYFIEGVPVSNDDRLTSIMSQLAVRAEASKSILTVSVKYDETAIDSTSLRNARNRLTELMDRKGSPSELYKANYDMEAAFTSLYTSLTQLEISDIDKGNIEIDRNRMAGAASLIVKSKYNETIREFNRSVLSVFPTNFLRNICFVPEPELFE